MEPTIMTGLEYYKKGMTDAAEICQSTCSQAILTARDNILDIGQMKCFEDISAVVKEQTDIILRCKVILEELVMAEPSLVHTSREQAILRRISEVLERTKT